MVMIDLETLSTRVDATILSIGAVVFSMTDTTELVEVEPFYTTVASGIGSQPNRVIQGETLAFWMNQKDEAKKGIFSSPVFLKDALSKLGMFFYRHNLRNSKVWTNGPSFDHAILEHAFIQHGMTIPWTYNAARDTRTIYDLAGLDVKKIVRTDVEHNAIDDCLFQIKCVQQAYKMLTEQHTVWGMPVNPPEKI